MASGTNPGRKAEDGQERVGAGGAHESIRGFFLQGAAMVQQGVRANAHRAERRLFLHGEGRHGAHQQDAGAAAHGG